MNLWKSIRVSLVMATIMISSTACLPNLGLRNFTGVKSTPVTDTPPVVLSRRAYVRGLPTGNDSYSQGFRDGCQTILGTTGAGTLRLLPERIDPERLVNDPLYLRGWHDGDGVCNDRIDWEGH